MCAAVERVQLEKCVPAFIWLSHLFECDLQRGRVYKLASRAYMRTMSTQSRGRGSMAGCQTDTTRSQEEVNSNGDRDTEANCGKCKREVKDTDNAVECEVCEVWFHIKCEDIPETVYNFMVKQEAGKQLSWHCSFCARGCIKLNSKVKKLDEQQKEMADKQKALSGALDGISGCVKVHQSNRNLTTGWAIWRHSP